MILYNLIRNRLTKRLRNTFDHTIVAVTAEDTLRFDGKNVEKLIDIVIALHLESRSNQEHNRTLQARAIEKKDVQMFRNPQTIALRD